MTALERAINDLVIANRILAHHGVFDEYGHVSVRHPGKPERYLLARACAGAFVEPGDILEFTLDGTPASEDNRPLCTERFLHAAIYGARPEVNSVLCAGSEDVLPFSVTQTPLCAVLGTVGDMGTKVPVWDITERFGGDTDLTVSTMERARDLAKRLGDDRVVLMRGIGFVATGRTLNDAVKTSVYIPKNARSLAQSLEFGTVRPISQGEVDQRLAIDPESNAMRRGWEYWARDAGCERWL
ncbi:MAG: class II aldolase/adducin family protein [Rhizobiales bacterium]|nr:class II aldolase/adducin family protein [Hyphomicrobiales bacterium]